MSQIITSLSGLLSSVREDNDCTQIHCTTCGASAFRKKLDQYLSVHQAIAQDCDGQSGPVAGWSKAAALILLAELRELPEPEALDFANRGALRLMLYLVWQALGGWGCEKDMEEVLGASEAGAVLGTMMSHEQQMRERRARHAARNDPETIARERAELRAKKADAHAERLRKKAERDALRSPTRQRGPRLN